MNESTSAGISGLHFGHLKTCAEDNLLSHFESSVSNIPYSTGYSPKSWQESIIVMIKKRSQSHKIEDQRSIVLMEADFNYNNKLLGKRTMLQAELQNSIAKEQYGSRKNKAAIDQAIHTFP